MSMLSSSITLLYKFPGVLGSEVDDLHSTDDRESSEESHIASNC